MADTTHDFGDDGFHEIHLSGKQLVFLFMATTVVSVIIFLLGVLVGRGVPTQRTQDVLAGLQTTASASTEPPPPASAGAGVPADEPPTPAAETDTTGLGYKERLESDIAVPETLKPAPERRQPEPRAEQPKEERASREAAPPERASRETASNAAPAAQQTLAGTPQPGEWVLQVHALRDRKMASSIAERLAKKGYPAFLVASGGPTSIYRVFVGRYRDRAEAERVAARLTKEEQFKPWITR